MRLRTGNFVLLAPKGTGRLGEYTSAESPNDTRSCVRRDCSSESAIRKMPKLVSSPRRNEGPLCAAHPVALTSQLRDAPVKPEVARFRDLVERTGSGRSMLRVEDVCEAPTSLGTSPRRKEALRRRSADHVEESCATAVHYRSQYTQHPATDWRPLEWVPPSCPRSPFLGHRSSYSFRAL